MEKYVNFDKIPENIKRIKLDVGLSCNAPYTIKWLEQENDLYVFGFEPNPYSVYSVIQIFNNRQDNNRFQLIPVALNNVEKETISDFYCMGSQNVGTSSLNKPNTNSLGIPLQEIIKVSVFPLKDFLEKFDWNRFPYIEYMKIDAQGSDIDIVKSAGEYLKKIVYITLEEEKFANYENIEHNNLNEFQKYFESMNFIMVTHPNTVDPTFLNKNYYHLKDEINIFQGY
jgi:FkbM family methyltransferase